MSKPTAVVTGAGSGIGRCVSEAFIHHGFRVVLAGRRQETLEETKAVCNSDDAIVIPCDVTLPDSVKQLFDRTVKTCRRVDVLFNNAGINLPATALEDLSFEDWRHVVDVNLTGVFLCTQAAVRVMKSQDPQGGRIINNGSISSQTPRPLQTAYTATKHAVTGLTKSTALDGRKYNIACGQIDIGNAATSMTQRMSQGVLQADGSIAAEPTMDAREIAKAVIYMASLPLNANVLTMTVMASGMPFVGRG